MTVTVHPLSLRHPLARVRRFVFLLAAFFMALTVVPAVAESTVTHLVGKVTVLRLDGHTEEGSVGMRVKPAEVISTGTNGFVRLTSNDGGWMVLPPNSQLKVEKYNYTVDKPTDDSFVFRVIKGGLRTASGLIGKRGNRDAYAAKALTATIGIRGTQYDMRVCENNSCGPSMPDGAYVAVKKGAVAMESPKGAVELKAGQVAAASTTKPPELLPYDPGVGFTPPPSIQRAEDAPPSPFQGTWTGRVQSAFFTSPAVIEINVINGRVVGKSSWNTKASPPEPFTNGEIKGDTLTFNYPGSYDTGKATLTLEGKGRIKAIFAHGTTTLSAELQQQ